MATIEYEIGLDPNFLRDMRYMAYLPHSMSSYEDKFKLAENVRIVFEETVNIDPNNSIPNICEVSEDGLTIDIKFITCRYHLGNGKTSEPPKPQEFYERLENYMKSVINDDNKRYENQEEE